MGVINRQNIIKQAHAALLADYRAESMDVPENVSFSINYRGSRMDCNVQFQEQLTPALLRMLTGEGPASQTEVPDEAS